MVLALLASFVSAQGLMTLNLNNNVGSDAVEK